MTYYWLKVRTFTLLFDEEPVDDDVYWLKDGRCTIVIR